MTNHYNGATIWGILDKFARKISDGGKPYVEIFIHCQHTQYGNVKVLGRIWGKDVSDAFMDDVREGKMKKGVELRLEGNMQQYRDKGENVRTSFNFYRYEFGPLKERKAAFRLVGEVVSFDDDKLKVLVIQEQKENFEPKQEEFEVVVPKIVQLEMPGNLESGTTVRIKGYLQCEEDEFGEAKEYQRPVVKQVEMV